MKFKGIYKRLYKSNLLLSVFERAKFLCKQLMPEQIKESRQKDPYLTMTGNLLAGASGSVREMPEQYGVIYLVN